MSRSQRRRRSRWWRRERRRAALRRLAIGPCSRLAVGACRKYGALVARYVGRVLRREIDEHRREHRVVLDVVETDLVVRVAVGVPGVAPVIPVTRAEAEARRSAREARGVIGG